MAEMSVTISNIPIQPVKDMESLNARKKAKKNDKNQKAQQPPKVTPLPFHQQLSSDIGRSVSNNSFQFKPANVLQSLVPPSLITNEDVPTLSNNSSATTLIGTESPRPKSIDSLEFDSDSQTPIQKPLPNLPKYDGHTYTLSHFAATQALEKLIEEHSSISHMGILDPNYTFYMNRSRSGALYYKVENKIAVIGGDPLCYPAQWSEFLAEFAQFRKKHGLGIAFLGASSRFAEFAAEKGWVSMRFGRERALNPITNPVLAERESKRVVKQVKQLSREGARVSVYIPAHAQDFELQRRLVNVYDAWRNHKNENGKPQAYMTIFDPFALPRLMIYIYTSDVQGNINGFAALRKLANGYHIDPYCALPDAPRGTSELLIYSAMAILNKAGISYLGLGFEPAEEMTEISGMGPKMTKMVNAGYKKTFSRLPISGKKAFHDKWHPDEEYDKGVYIVYPDGQPGLRHSLAMMHFANVSAKEMIGLELKQKFEKRRERKLAAEEAAAKSVQPIQPVVAYGVHESSQWSVHLAVGRRTA